MISSAEDRNDRILGAMYVVTTFTMVNRQARIAYPWLYDSVAFQEPPEMYMPQIEPFDTLFGINWLQGVFIEPIPPLSLANATPNTEPNTNTNEQS